MQGAPSLLVTPRVIAAWLLSRIFGGLVMQQVHSPRGASCRPAGLQCCSLLMCLWWQQASNGPVLQESLRRKQPCNCDDLASCVQVMEYLKARESEPGAVRAPALPDLPDDLHDQVCWAPACNAVHAIRLAVHLHGRQGMPMLTQ